MFAFNKNTSSMSFSTASAHSSNNIMQRPLILAFAGIFAAFWFVSFAGTTDLANWWIENLLVIIFTTSLVLTFRRFAFSDLSYAFILAFLILHVYGAKYAYADNPFGFYLQHQFSTARNPYDRIVHSSFGLLMAYPMRELLMRQMKTSERWASILPIELVLSLSGLFELIEWAVADVFFPEHGINYVGSQGDIWDAQKDMFLATCGAVVIMVLVKLARQATVVVRARRMKALAA
jgi:putative membrane protein